MIKAITSKDNQRVKYALSLKDSKTRKELGEFLAESFKTLEMALKANLVKEVFSLKWLDLPEEVNQNLVSEDILKKLSSSKNPEGVVFIGKMKEKEDKEYKKILYLDEINDPGNLGTLIRTALAFDYDAVITSKNSVSIYNEKTIAASKGAIFMIDCFVDDLANYKKTHKVIVTALDKDSISLDEIKAPDKFVLVLGNEAHGVSKENIKLADYKVIIPISNIDSLNVAIAGGILMNKLR